MTERSDNSHRRRLAPYIVPLLTIAMSIVALPSLASHPEESLGGSNFEIDTDANLIVNDAGRDDWQSVVSSSDFASQADVATGSNDNSFKGGVKEDTACPTTTTGSIPNNKSDLKAFGIYQEPGNPGFVHLFWSRVQDPSGTTLMDFEFNQSGTACASGSLFKERTVDDLLLEYSLEQGGATATLTVRKWNGSAWGNPQNLTAVGEATGTINNSSITAANSITGVGSQDPRTFGEASFDLGIVFDSNQCTSFGSVTLKSRSSDSFTSQLKDFITPLGVNIANCGRIVVEKVDNQNARLAGAQFTVTPGKTTASGTATSSVMTGVSTGLFCIDSLLLNVEYNVSESQTPTNYLPAADKKFTVTEPGSCANVTSSTTPDLTFVNQPATRDVRLVKNDDDGNALPGVVFTLYADTNGDGALQSGEEANGVTATTNSSGVATWTGVVVGKYCAKETGPVSGYTGLANPVCFTLATGEGAFTIPGGPFVNPQQHRVIVLVCHQATNTLAQSGVTLSGQTQQSLNGTGLTAAQQAALCGLGGANFGGLGHGNQSLTVNVGSAAHTP